MPVRNYSFGAGETKHLGAGNRLRLLDSTAQVTVKFYRDGSEISTETAEGVEAGYQGEPPREDGKSAFDDVTVYSATAQTVKILTTRGDSRYDRTVGDVQSEPKLTQSAADPVGEDALTANGYAFAAPAGIAANPATNSHCQLWNPAGSGKVIFVDSVVVSSVTGATIVGLGYYNTVLSTAYANGTNKNVGGADSSASTYVQQNAGGLATKSFSNLFIPAANQADRVTFKNPIRLAEGQGLLVYAGTVNLALSAAFEFREYA